MNGFISMGTIPSSSPPTIPGSINVVSPYGADIDTGIAGAVRYTRFLTSHPEMRNVSEFISTKMGVSFTGTRMMVAEWDGVAKSGGSSVSSVTVYTVATWFTYGMLSIWDIIQLTLTDKLKHIIRP